MLGYGKTLISRQRCGVCVEPASLGELLGMLVFKDLAEVEVEVQRMGS